MNSLTNSLSNLTGCCQKAHNSQTCTEVKKNAVALITALSAIALVASVLSVLSLHGYSMAGINAIPNALGAGGVYGLLIGSTILSISCLVMIAAMRNPSKQTAESKSYFSSLKEWCVKK